jgi:hypothetical protein
VAWDLEVTDEFEQWWQVLPEEEQISVDAVLRLLEIYGSALDHPYSREVEGARHVRCLRVPHASRSMNVLYFCFPWRSHLLLLSGASTDACEHPDAAQLDRAQHTLTAYLGRCERQAS